MQHRAWEGARSCAPGIQLAIKSVKEEQHVSGMVQRTQSWWKRCSGLFVCLFALAAFSGDATASDVIYDYDPTTGRLIRATFADGVVVIYEYDNNGNRTKVTTTGANRGLLSLAAVTYSGGETSGQRLVTIQVQRTGGNYGEARVAYGSSDGTATAASGDYVAGAGTLTWGHGDASPKAFTVTVLDDATLEVVENFSVQLSGAAGASLVSPTSATISIVDDEADTLPPSAPGEIQFPSVGETSVTALWAGAMDNRGVTRYRYRLDAGTWQVLGNVLTTNLTELANGTQYSFELQAGDAAGNWGPSRTASFTTVDTGRPTNVTTLTATVATSTRIDLSWAAASDNVAVTGYEIERCSGEGCANFEQIAIATVTSHADDKLVSSMSYRYRVRARDAAGNTSAAWSPIAEATTQLDTSAPSVPTNFAATAPSGTEVRLTWNASTDSGGSGMAGYKIERCTGADCVAYQQIATTASTNYLDTGRAASTEYGYRIRAYDNAGNDSPYTAAIGVVTPADAIAPTAPTQLAANAVTSTRIDLGWAAAMDSGGSGLVGYRVERCQGVNCSNFAEIGTAAANSYSDVDRAALTAYQYRVRAYDGAGNVSTSYSNTASATTPADTIAPISPAGFNATSSGSTQIDLSWNAATDQGGAGLAGYELQRCQGSGCSNFAALTTSSATSYGDTNLSASATYAYRLRAFDAANPANRSGWIQVTATTDADIEAPTQPPTLTVTAVSSTQLNLSWVASTERGGSSLAGYEVERCQGANCSSFASLATVPSSTTTYANSELAANTVYMYRVRAYDTANPANRSTYISASGTTLADTQAPSAPASLSGAAASGSQVNLNWAASADSGGAGLAGYEIERCQGAGCSSFGQIGTSSGTSYADSNLTDARTYVYRVRAYDYATPANRSGYSNVVSIATPDVSRPSAPQSMSVSNTRATSATVTWSAASDNVGVTGYDYQINGGNWSAASSPLPLTGLVVNTSYTVSVRARDAAGNISNTPASTSFTTVDDVAPNPPGAISFPTVTSHSVRVTWTSASDNVAVTGYRYRVNGAAWQTLGNVNDVSFGGLSQGTQYTVEVQARDARGNWSGSRSSSFITKTLTGSLGDYYFGCYGYPGYEYGLQRDYRLTVNGPSISGSCYTFSDSGTLGAWRLPASEMSQYQARATSTCPNRYGSPVGTWIPLTSSPYWGVYASGYESGVNCHMTVEVSAIANPGVVLDSANIYFAIYNGA